MKATGIVRPLDDLGRIVVPIELRRRLDLQAKDPVEIFVEDEKVILKKYEPACVFCGDADNVFTYKTKLVCESCLAEMNH